MNDLEKPLTADEAMAFKAGWAATATGNRDHPDGLDTALGMYERGFNFGDEEKGEQLLRPCLDVAPAAEHFWLILHEPACVPELKGPWPWRNVRSTLREFLKARPTAYIDVLTIGSDGAPQVDHGPEWLQILDGRSMSVGRRHNAKTRDAHAPFHAALKVARDVFAERRRHITDEGWTPEHDDEHGDGEMAIAAAAYALGDHRVYRITGHDIKNGVALRDRNPVTAEDIWPWDGKWWKPGAVRRNLVKAGALILAEIERQDRKAGEGA